MEHAVAVVDGLDGAFDAWLGPHLPSMWVLARRLAGPEAEDVLQEALELAWRRRKTYDPSRGSPLTWLLMLVADRARKRWRSLRVHAHLDDTRPATSRDADQALDVGRAVERLAPRQRLAVELHYVLGLTVVETAQAMGCAEGTVKSTLSDARRLLRIALEVQE